MITGDILGERARLSPDVVALIHAPTRRQFTYAELDRRALQCARVWTDLCSLHPGDRACILSENRVEYVDAFWAAGKSGIILVPLGTRSTAHELSQVVADCGPRCLMYSAGYEKLAKELCELVAVEHCINLDTEDDGPNELSYAKAVDRVRPDALSTRLDPEDVFCLLYTSGTTGRPKGVMIPHRQIAWNAYNTVISWQLRQTDRVQVYTPMYHAGGLTVFMAPLFAIGGSIVLHDGFDPAELLRAFGEYQCTILFGVPTIFKMLLAAPEFSSLDTSHLRWCCSGGAPLALEILRAFQERGLIFRQGYGLTEVGVNCFAMSDEDSLRKSGSIGKPMMFTEAKLVDHECNQVATNEVGELCLRGPHVCQGYWNNAAATAQALDTEGWFHTGDLARRDEDGFFYIAGRSKDMIISGGVNIYPAEIEKELLVHPAVAEVCVIGVADEKWGEVPVAFAALKPEESASELDLIEFLRPKINKIKLPRQVIFIDALPRNAYGKVLKRNLQDRLRHLRLGTRVKAILLRWNARHHERCFMKRIYIAAYHQSKFGKLMGMPVPEILRRAVMETCAEIKVEPSAIDVGSVGAVCNISLNQQGLLAGLVADIPGLAGKPIESVENACASGGQAVLSVVQKLQIGWGDIGIAIGYEKMRDADGKMDGKLIGQALGYFSHPAEREGKVYIFPHLFAEVMECYLKVHGIPEEHLAQIAVTEYANARHNEYAQMRNVELTVEQAMQIGGINRYIVEGLPLKTYDCSQISDGYAALILATEEGLAKLGVDKRECVEIAGYAQATDPLKKAGRDVLRPAGAIKAMNDAYRMASVTKDDVKVAEIHDCFTVMGALGTEVLGKAEYGKGAQYWVDGKAAVGGECGINTSGGLIAKGHPIGATGVAMLGWCAWQLLGKVPKPLQVKDAHVAATFNIGGPICASVCTVLKY